MNSINKNGYSVCDPGKENYCTFTVKIKGKSKKMYQYDYRTESGDLFAYCAPSLEACREKRDIWLRSRQ